MIISNRTIDYNTFLHFFLRISNNYEVAFSYIPAIFRRLLRKTNVFWRFHPKYAQGIYFFSNEISGEFSDDVGDKVGDDVGDDVGDKVGDEGFHAEHILYQLRFTLVT